MSFTLEQYPGLFRQVCQRYHILLRYRAIVRQDDVKRCLAYLARGELAIGAWVSDQSHIELADEKRMHKFRRESLCRLTFRFGYSGS